MKKNEILQYLKESEDYISGEELSRKLGISRAGVWKIIQGLRKDGYVIQSITNRGYKLFSSNDALTPEEISAGLSVQTIGKQIHFLQKVDSTNEEAKRQAQQGAPHGSVFIAEEQTGGKGRLGRQWQSPPKTGLWFTALLRPDISPNQAAGITLLVGLAVCNAIRRYTGCQAMIKWPNDIVIGSKKVCGILAEMAAEFDKIDYVVVGIGINVNNDQFAEELKVKATSLKLETGGFISRVGLLQHCLQELDGLYHQYFFQDMEKLTELYKAQCVTLHRQVSTVKNGMTVSGTAVDITAEGELIIRCNNGSLLQINSGEVTVQGIYGQ